MADLISVIVPVYNAEKHLGKCIESILNQTFQDFELILVDDGSKDNSYNICKLYRERDSRIKLFQQKNEGAGAARNKGLSMASGNFVLFLDSDDWIESNLIETLYNNLIGYHADLSICNFFIEDLEGKNRSNELFEIANSPYYTEDIAGIISVLDNQRKLPYLWNRMYRKAIIDDNNVSFDTFFITGQDLDFNVKYLKHTQSCVVSNDALYHYIKDGTDSLCARYKKNLYDIVCRLNSCRESLYSYYSLLSTQEGRELFETTYVEYLHTCIPNLFRKYTGLTYKEKLRQIQIVFSDKGLKDYIGAYKPKSKEQRLFKKLLELNSPKTAYCIYQILFWIRNNHQWLYRLLKRGRL